METELSSAINAGSVEPAATDDRSGRKAHEPVSEAAATGAIVASEQVVVSPDAADGSGRIVGEAAGPSHLAMASEETLLGEIFTTVREVAEMSRLYHIRAEQRESVIDLLRSEIAVLRRGERRGLLRPVLADLCRLRSDLLAQAATLPEDLNVARATDLLRSYAESIQLTLDSNGVVIYASDGGDQFDPRLHRRVGGNPTSDPALAGRVAEVQRHGYLDVAAYSPIAPAEVTVFASAKETEGKQ